MTFPSFEGNGYKIVELLNPNFVGGRQTYLAQKLSNNQLVVIKQFSFARPDSGWKGYKQLEREIRFLQELSHPQICKYIDLINNPQGLSLVVEYIEGTTLENKILGKDEIFEVANQVLDILIYLQKNNVVHRDLKPANLIINNEGKIHLIDFGLASILSDQSLSTSSVLGGTLGFMPNEQIFKREVNFTTDVYALGVVIFLLYQPNLKIENVLDSSNRIPVNMLGGIADNSIIEWLHRVLSLNVQQRYSSAILAKDALNRSSTDIEIQQKSYSSQEQINSNVQLEESETSQIFWEEGGELATIELESKVVVEPEKNELGVYLLLFVGVVAALIFILIPIIQNVISFLVTDVDETNEIFSSQMILEYFEVFSAFFIFAKFISSFKDVAVGDKMWNEPFREFFLYFVIYIFLKIMLSLILGI